MPGKNTHKSPQFGLANMQQGGIFLLRALFSDLARSGSRWYCVAVLLTDFGGEMVVWHQLIEPSACDTRWCGFNTFQFSALKGLVVPCFAPGWFACEEEWHTAYCELHND
jgi:hypothetical protein